VNTLQRSKREWRGDPLRGAVIRRTAGSNPPIRAHPTYGIRHGGQVESSEAMQTEGGPGPVRDSPGTFQERRGGEDPSNRARQVGKARYLYQ